VTGCLDLTIGLVANWLVKLYHLWRRCSKPVTCRYRPK